MTIQSIQGIHSWVQANCPDDKVFSTIITHTDKHTHSNTYTHVRALVHRKRQNSKCWQSKAKSWQRLKLNNNKRNANVIIFKIDERTQRRWRGHSYHILDSKKMSEHPVRWALQGASKVPPRLVVTRPAGEGNPGPLSSEATFLPLPELLHP